MCVEIYLRFILHLVFSMADVSARKKGNANFNLYATNLKWLELFSILSLAPTLTKAMDLLYNVILIFPICLPIERV